MATHNLQLKRNKNIFSTKEEALNHLNSLVNKLEDGEIVLCRYFNNETIQTLIGFETKYEITNEETQEKEVISAIAYVDSFSEVGGGLFRDDNGILQLDLGEGLKIDDENKIQLILGDGIQIKEGKVDVRINNAITNFLHIDENGMKVDDMDANVTKTTEKILVMGGPLDTPILRSVVDKDENGNACINSGTNIQALLYKLLCKEIYPYNTVDDEWYMQEEVDGGNQAKISYINHSFAISIPQPTITDFLTSTVEVGTKFTFKVNAKATSVSKTSSQVKNMTWGYAEQFNANPSINTSQSIQKDWQYGIDNDNYILQTNVNKGFGNVSISDVTGTTNSLPQYSQNVTVDEGENKITWNISGATYSATIETIESVYLASNLGNLKEEIKTNVISGATYDDLTTPSNTINKTVNGVRYSFTGSYTSNFPSYLNSDVIRALTSQKNNKTFSIDIAEGTSHVVIAIPANLSLKEVKDEAAFGTNISGRFKPYFEGTSGKVKVEGANNYNAIEYNVYIYAPDAKLGKNTYNVTIE